MILFANVPRPNPAQANLDVMQMLKIIGKGKKDMKINEEEWGSHPFWGKVCW
jgi:hypothetical protein